MTKELVKQDKLTSLLTRNFKSVQSVLPKHLTPERVLRIAHTVINQNSKLRNCTELSLANAIIESSMLGLEIGGPIGMAYLVPYGDKAQLIIGYKGYMDLAYRSDRISNFSFHPVYEKDDFHYNYGLEPKLHHIPCNDEDPGALEYAYAVVNFKTGGFDFEVVNKRIAMAAKNRSAAKSKKDSPWNTEDEYTMWCKTAVRRIAKRIPLSPELQRAAAIEDRADAGVDQGLNYIMDAEFSPSDDNETLTEKIKGETGEKECPNKDGEKVPATECKECKTRERCPSWS